MFVFRSSLEATSTDSRTSRVDVAFTDSSLDLGEGSDADAPRLADALSRLEAACGVRPVRMRQVHGADVQTVEASPDSPASPPAEVDALVTRQPGLALVARAADCVPVLLADAEAGVVGAVHSGRVGLVAGVVPQPSAGCASSAPPTSPRGSGPTSAVGATRCPPPCETRSRP